MGRQVKNIHYIYKTTCNVTGRYYVGMHSTNNLNDGYMGSGLRLRRSIRKYGVENHIKEILEFFDTRELLIEGEKKAITPDMLLDDMCMNLMAGGNGGFISDEQQKHRATCAGKAMGEKRKNDKVLDERLRLMARDNFINAHKNGKIKYDTFKNRKHSEETKQLMSEVKKGSGMGENNSQYGTCWITNEIENKKIYKGDEIPNGWRLGRVTKR